ncbi:MAG TPA: FAD-binding oxidoreductase [Cyclobacteriaceae bacterium]|nr:FAD-binding oxidoreductase [Cyclobacteriaceae bacterium]
MNSRKEYISDQWFRSYWTDSTHFEEHRALTSDLKTDVVVIGGGVTGLSVAYSLIKEGKGCIVIESGTIGGGETQHSSAHLTQALDSRYYTLQQIYGIKNTSLIAQSHTAAINRIERIIKRENINCDFQRLNGYLVSHPSDTAKSLQREFEATRRVGLATELLTTAEDMRLRDKIALKFPRQAQFHPLKYLQGLCRAFVQNGGHVFTNTRAVSIDESGVNTSHHRIHADHVVVATNQPFNDRFTMLTKQIQYRSYIIAATVHKGLISPCLWWDTGRQSDTGGIAPYNYARIQPMDEEYDLIICGGQDHVVRDEDGDGKEQASPQYEHLESWLFDHFPLARDVAYRWSGLVLEPEDMIGFIGRNVRDTNIYVITGDAGNGMTYAGIAGVLIPDLILGRKNPWEKIYSPVRLSSHVPDRSLRKKTQYALAQ